MSILQTLHNERDAFAQGKDTGKKNASNFADAEHEADANVTDDVELKADTAGNNPGRSSLALAGKLNLVDEGTRRASLTVGDAAGVGGHRASLRASLNGGGAALRASLTGGGAAIRASLMGTTDPVQDELSKFEEAEQEEEDHARIRNFDPSQLQKDELATADSALSFKEISFFVKVPDLDADPSGRTKIKKPILENAWGHFQAGSLVALMGPSGCGKSTLLDILAQKKTAKYEGTVYMNGRRLDGMYPRVMSYVGQQDIMNQYWTVGEAVMFDLLLKKPAPKGLPRQNLDMYVNTLLDDVGLLAVKNSKIGGSAVRGISGGQKRRVTLARGIAGKASLMFCDEPTSGLSATDAELCVKALLGMARKWNVTIVVVIHQPRVEVAELFDHLLLLTSRPGRTVYNGSMKDAADYWSLVGFPVPVGTNPCDHFLDKVTPGAEGAHPDAFVQYYKENELPGIMKRVDEVLENPGKAAVDILEHERSVMLQFGQLPKIRASRYGTSWFTQWRVLLHRKLKLTFLNLPLLGVSFGAPVFVGLLMGAIFQDIGSKEPKGAVQVSMFFILLFRLTYQTMNTLPMTFDERLIMKSETSEALYCTTAYVCASGLVDTIICTIACVAEMSIVMAFSGIGQWDKFPEFLLWAVMLSMSMESIILCVAAAAKTMQVALNVALPILTIPICYGGFLVTRSTCPDPWCLFVYVSPLHFIMEKFTSLYYADDEFAWRNIEVQYGHKKPDLWVLLAYCGGFFVVFRFLHVVILAKMNNIQK